MAEIYLPAPPTESTSNALIASLTAFSDAALLFSLDTVVPMEPASWTIPDADVEAVGKLALDALILPLESWDTDVMNAVPVPLADGAAVVRSAVVTAPEVPVTTARSAMEPILPSFVMLPCVWEAGMTPVISTSVIPVTCPSALVVICGTLVAEPLAVYAVWAAMSVATVTVPVVSSEVTVMWLSPTRLIVGISSIASSMSACLAKSSKVPFWVNALVVVEPSNAADARATLLLSL